MNVVELGVIVAEKYKTEILKLRPSLSFERDINNGQNISGESKSYQKGDAS